MLTTKLLKQMSKEQNQPQRKPLKLFGGNKLPKNWNAEKAAAQIDEVMAQYTIDLPV